jgi:hypothetical protein
MLKVEVLEACWFRPFLRKDQLEFISTTQHQLCPGLGTHTDPVNSPGGKLGAVRLDRDLEPAIVERINERFVKL